MTGKDKAADHISKFESIERKLSAKFFFSKERIYEPTVHKDSVRARLVAAGAFYEKLSGELISQRTEEESMLVTFCGRVGLCGIVERTHGGKRNFVFWEKNDFKIRNAEARLRPDAFLTEMKGDQD